MATNDKGSKQEGKSGSKQSGDTSKRGFASMDPEQQREIAAEGGRAAHEKGTAHEFTSEEARRAGAMSHKNDPGRNSQSASSGSGSRGSAGAGNKGGADEDDEEEDEGGGGSGGKGGRGSSGRSKT
ncbi:hypothetical protein FHW83_003582 [Duganella sp. SG902]|uniref:KGG domain-containing protein n=1 Tax=Duganella sp. SG902 TaxID=2587016 RepID=UPI00159E392B|nr:KGG domain-containing protein [Duganella sp. SG902]NVM77759.1 hypothetical protein [Duganella sp. SG902]